MAFPAFAEEPEQPITGSCGEKLTWTYYQSTKTLTIDGNGNMPNYPADKYEGSIAPWRNNSNIDNFLEKVVGFPRCDQYWRKMHFSGVTK